MKIPFIARLPRFNLKLAIYHGEVDGFFETGTEGVWWSVTEDHPVPYAGLHLIESGDLLTIWDKSDKIKFQGLVLRDGLAGWTNYPANPDYGQPCALGLWIHWTQVGWEPDQWASLFFTKVDGPDGYFSLLDTHYRGRIIRFGPCSFLGKIAEELFNRSRNQNGTPPLLFL